MKMKMMSGNGLWLVTMVVVCALLQKVSSLVCHEEDMPSICHCQEDQPGTYVVMCTCQPGEALIISYDATHDLPWTASAFHVHDCNSPVTIMANAFDNLQSLENITFRNISHLTLKPKSLELQIFNQKNFQLTFDTVLNLSLEQNAVMIYETAFMKKEIIIIQNTSITNLEGNAINSSFSELRLEHVVLSQAPGSRAIDVGSKGASVFINFLNASNEGLTSEWMTGTVSHLTIANSSLTLLPNAFAGVYMQASPHPAFHFHNNQLGYPKWFPGHSGTMSVPSLPTGALDLKVPSNGIFVDASNNQITCSCQDIVWLQENAITPFKSKLQKSFKCKDGDIVSAIAKCDVPTNHSLAPVISLSLTLIAISWVLLVLS